MYYMYIYIYVFIYDVFVDLNDLNFTSTLNMHISISVSYLSIYGNRLNFCHSTYPENSSDLIRPNGQAQPLVGAA